MKRDNHDPLILNQLYVDINKKQSALQSLRKERAHTEDYLQNAAAKKKELDKELNASFNYRLENKQMS